MKTNKSHSIITIELVYLALLGYTKRNLQGAAYVSEKIDFGPISDFEQYAFDGLMNAGFLFQAMSGNVAIENGKGLVDLPTDPILAIHYLVVILALIGGFIIVLNRKCHTPTVAFSWLFLLLICVIGPVRTQYSPFFQRIENQHAYSDIKAFTPQVQIIDIMSKIHRAVYVALFDYQGNGKSSIRNYVEGISGKAGSGVLPSANYNKDDDLQSLMSSYEALCTGGSTNNHAFNAIIYPFANQPIDKALTEIGKQVNGRDWITAINRSGGRPDMAHTTLIETAKKLESQYFALGDVAALNSAYTFSHVPGHPPYAIYYKDKAAFVDSFVNSGLLVHNNATEIDKTATAALINYDKMHNKASDLTYLMTRHDKLVNPLEDGYSTSIGFIKSGITHGAKNFTFLNEPFKRTKIGTEDTIKKLGHGITSKTKMGIQRESSADTRFLGNLFTWSSNSDNPVGYRLWEDKETFPNESEKEALDVLLVQEKLKLTPVSLGFVLNAPVDAITKALMLEHCKGTSDCAEWKLAPISGKSSKVTRHLKVNSCAELHHVINMEASGRAVLHSNLPGALLDKTAFKNYIFNNNGDTSVAANRGIMYYKSSSCDLYCAYQKWIKEKKNLGGNLGTFFNYVDNRINTLVRVDTNNNLEHIFETGNVNLISHVLEIERQSLLAAINSATLRQTTKHHPPLNLKYSGLDQAMNTQFSSSTLDDRLDGLSDGSRLLGAIATAVDHVGVWWDSQFEGAEAIVYTAWIRKFTALALFLVLLATPMLYMVGLVNPSQAPGIIINSLLLVLVIKMVPITFTLIDFAISYTMQSSMMFSDNTPLFGMFNADIDSAIMVYVIAGAYSSVVIATLFLLFKAGDTQMIMGKMSELDGQANKVAAKSVDAAQTIASAAAVVAGGGLLAGAGGAAALAGSKGGASLAAAAGKSAARSAFNAFGKLPTGKGDFISGGIAESFGEIGEGREEHRKIKAKLKVGEEIINEDEGTGKKERSVLASALAYRKAKTDAEYMKELDSAYKTSDGADALRGFNKAEQEGRDMSRVGVNRWNNESNEKNSRLDTASNKDAWERNDDLLQKWNRLNGTNITWDDIRYDNGLNASFQEYAGKIGKKVALDKVGAKIAAEGGDIFIDTLSRQFSSQEIAVKRSAKASDVFEERTKEIKLEKEQAIRDNLSGREKNNADSNSYKRQDDAGNWFDAVPKPESTVDMTGAVIKDAEFTLASGAIGGVKDMIANDLGINKEQINNGMLKELSERQGATTMGSIRNGLFDTSFNLSDVSPDFQTALSALDPSKMARILSGATGETVTAADQGYEQMKAYLEANSSMNKRHVDAISSDEIYSLTPEGKSFYEDQAKELVESYKDEHKAAVGSRRLR